MSLQMDHCDGGQFARRARLPSGSLRPRGNLVVESAEKSRREHEQEQPFALGENRSGGEDPTRDYAACFSFRARLCVGCTSHAIPMLTPYSATIGAAKMHMLKMSGVGVTMAATMKIRRMA